MIEVLVPPGVDRLATIFCGCGRPDLAWDAVHRQLKQLDAEDDLPHTGEWYVLAYLLDYLRLTEHGGSVDTVWLRDEGEQVVAFLEQWGTDWNEENVLFVNKEGVVLGGRM